MDSNEQLQFDLKQDDVVREYSKKCSATVSELIEHLLKNFKPTDRLCFWDEGGAHMECVHVPKDFLEADMFKYVKDDKIRRMNMWNETKEQVDKDFEFVDDNDVIVY